MNGATLAEIAEVLGHKTLAMVKRYAHLSEQHTGHPVTQPVGGWVVVCVVDRSGCGKDRQAVYDDVRGALAG